MTLIVCGDVGAGSCGVGDSVGRWIRQSGQAAHLEICDPKQLRVRDLPKLLKRTSTAVLVYPSNSTKQSVRLLIVATALRLLSRPTNLHLHEYTRLHWTRRVVARLLLRATSGNVIVSTLSEAQGVPHSRVRVSPPAAGAAPALKTRSEVGSPSRTSTSRISVFGIARADKGLQGLWQWLGRGDERPIELQLIGSSWLKAEVPSWIRDKYTVVTPGFVPLSELSELFAATTLAIAPFSDGATDGRTSLRTPAAYGAPVATRFPAEPSDLSLRDPLIIDLDHIGRDDILDLDIPASERARLARRVADFETDVIRKLDQNLLEFFSRESTSSK